MKSALHLAAAPNGLQKIVGITVGATALFAAALNLSNYLSQSGKIAAYEPLELYVYLLLPIGVVGFISSFWNSPVARWAQILIFFATSVLSSITTTDSGNVMSSIFLIFGLILIVEYDLGRGSIWVGVAFIAFVYIPILVVAYRGLFNPFIFQIGKAMLSIVVLVVLFGAVILKHQLRHSEDRELLESRVRERTEELERALAERSVMLQEIHHRVKNNLQIIASILQLETGVDEGAAVRASREKSVQRIHAMALVHETLYRTEQLENVDLAQYANRLVDEVRAGSSIEFILTAERPVLVGLDFAVPFGLLLSELLTNAQNHAFPAGFRGRVSICIDESDGIGLSVSDNGSGISEDIRVEGATTLGLNLVNLLASQLRGRVSLDRKTGTTWKIRFDPP